MNHAASAVLAIALSIGLLHLQNAAAAQQPVAFDVASVKPSSDPRTTGGMVRPDTGSMQPGGRWVASFVPLEAIIQSAYPGHAFAGQIVGGPAWIRSASPGARLTAGGTTIDGIAWLIAAQVGRPVIDATGLSEPFDIDMVFSSRPLTATPAGAPDDASSIFEAMRDQLGLRLEAGRADVDVLVIDRVERPTPD